MTIRSKIRAITSGHSEEEMVMENSVEETSPETALKSTRKTDLKSGASEGENATTKLGASEEDMHEIDAGQISGLDSLETHAPETNELSADGDLPIDEDAQDEEEYWDEEYQEENSGGFGQWVKHWAPTLLAVILASAWSGFFVWTNWAQMQSGADPAQWSRWIVAWTVPILFIVALRQIFHREDHNKGFEAGQYALEAQNLAAETDRLEERMITINRELSLAREFLASETRDLESMGRSASTRLSKHAKEIETLITTNGQKIDDIANVSQAALGNMDKLRSDLPVIATSARDVASQIGGAGNAAHERIDQLIAGFERLNEFGTASETQVDVFEGKIASAIEHLEDRSAVMVENIEQVQVSLRDGEDSALDSWDARIKKLEQQLREALAVIQKVDEAAINSATTKLIALKEEAGNIDTKIAERDALYSKRVSERREALTKDEETAIKALDDQLERLDNAISKRREALNQSEEEAAQTLTTRFETMDEQVLARLSGQEEAVEALAERSEQIAERIGALAAVMEEITQLGQSTEEAVARGTANFTGSLEEGREIAASTETILTDLTDASVRLLELIQAGSEHCKDPLSVSLEDAELRINQVVERAQGLKDLIQNAADQGLSLNEYVAAARDAGIETHAAFEKINVQMQETHSETSQVIDQMRENITRINEEGDILSEKAQDSLRLAIEGLMEVAQKAPETLESNLGESIRKLAESLGQKTEDILEQTLRDTTSTSIGRLEAATAIAQERGTETAIQLRDSLAVVDELTGNLESRVERARELAEDQVNNDFARRMSLITERLNSGSVDIAKAMSEEVTDTAWASYLKGDRGIFTRRAVQLLDNGEARDIADLYQNDPEFHDNVSRYIHDFESMLRSMLSTRDGNVLGVTVLSSDMGKLYVALAQAIKRLRN